MFLLEIIKNRITVLISLLILVVFTSSCKKNTLNEDNPAVLHIFNGLDNGTSLIGNYSESRPDFFSQAQQITNRNSSFSSFKESTVKASYFASPDTLDKDGPVFEETLELGKGLTYSLYMMGDKSAVDYLLIENKLKANNPNDSVTYVSVVNISNDQPISVNVKDEPNGSLINSLSYKGFSDFLELKADWTHPEYEFEFRDAATGELLATYTAIEVSGPALPVNRYMNKNWTLVFAGIRGTTDANAPVVNKIEHF